jgi:hypothetical protein
MRLRSPFLAFVGLLVLGMAAVELLQGNLTVTDAAVRVGVVTAALVGVDRLLLPLAGALLTGRSEQD